MGHFRINAEDGRAEWSDQLFELHGMAPGEVVPSRDVLLWHVHPDQRERVDAALRSCVRSDQPVALSYVLVDLAGDELMVDLTAVGQAGPDGRRAIVGFLLDAGVAFRSAVAAQVDDQLRRAVESHAVIDQAKGVLMLVYGIDGEAAFELLRWSSQQRNVKLLSLAERVVRAAVTVGGLAPDVRAQLDELFFVAFGEEAVDLEIAAMGIDVTTAVHDGVAVLTVRGTVDLATAGTFAAALAAAPRPSGGVVIDLREASHVGSAGVAVLASLSRRERARGLRLRIVAAPGSSLALAGDALDVVEAASRP
ncbi:ANTAR domain-containing protein [Cellulomonas alba]|uniref:ANTAR domain-containing protein n=1 Tax=Cellulomonas alba TaxID=3053467 RepID=A0ABT7SCQ4_9CELL|nr:ANTAR domain-containing protein [Cellulomonas alba]MDM7853834.1 ANTAR domain-containing protein [Cellulomonas alba]